MKFRAFLQMIFGGLTVFSTWQLTTMDRHTDPSGLLVPNQPPIPISPFVLLFLGIAILICGYLQSRARIKFAVQQIASGIIITINSSFLSFMAKTRRIEEIPNLLYGYILLILFVLGVIVIAVGIAQIVTTSPNTKKTITGAD